MTNDKKTAVVLFSGGLDSTTVLALAIDQGFAVHALTIDYGQRHRFEIEAARSLASDMGARHTELRLNLSAFGGSALTDENIAVPKSENANEIGEGIPVTYVPARNLVFLSVALSLAESVGAQDIFIGVNAVDYSGYPDCRPEFMRSFEETANLGTKAGVEGEGFKIHAPLSGMSKNEIIQTGALLGVDYGRTHSCYDPSPDGLACGHCDSCLLRKKGFDEAGVVDPTRYVDEVKK